MSIWLMVWQSGYVRNGEEITFEDHVTEQHGWDGPEAAQKAWRTSRTYRHGQWTPYGNGRQETHDVSCDPSYRDLGISIRFTRAFFVLVPADSEVSTNLKCLQMREPSTLC